MSDNVAEYGSVVVTYFTGPAGQPVTRRRVQITDRATDQVVAMNAHVLASLVDQLLEHQNDICPCGFHSAILASDA